VAYHGADHVDAEQDVVAALDAAACKARWLRAEGCVSVYIDTWHARPAAMRRKKDRGDTWKPYKGKPDADNIAKLVMDAATKAGIWRDDTQVSDLLVRRRWLAVDEEGHEVGLPRVCVAVEVM
jgi:Holliday junction resolvase RusA-like endonuclease